MPGTPTRYVRRVWSVFRTYGAGGLTRRLADKVRHRLGLSSEGYQAFVDAKARADAAFDESTKTDTGGVQHLPGLTIASPNAVHGSSHIAVSPSEFTASLTVAELGFVAPDQASFVDFGSGKARALLMAADRGYRRMIGVEFAAELDAVARRNVASRADCDRFTLIHGDATEYDLPDGPVMLFLYHPFDRPVMTTVVRRARESWLANPRPMRAVYQNPVFADEWTKGGWPVIANAPDCIIFAPDQVDP